MNYKTIKQLCAAAALLACIACGPTWGSAAAATTYIKAANATTLDLAGSWTVGGPPSGLDIAQWNNIATATGDTVTTGAGVNFGEIQIVNPAGLVTINQGTGGLTLNAVGAGVGIDMSAATQNLTINAALTLVNVETWNVAAGRILTISGNAGLAQGTNGITLNGLGTVLFSPTTTFTAPSGTGTVTVNGGLLNISNGTVTTSLTNALSGTDVLAVGGGTTQMTVGAGAGTFTQNFASTTVNGGGSVFGSNRGSGSNWVINLASITRNVAGTVFINASNTAASGYKFGNGSGGIVGGFLTVNGTDYVKFTNATTLVANNGTSAPTYTNDAWAAANNTTVTLATNTAYNNVTTNSLRFAAVASDTVTLSGTNTIGTGGILNSSTVTNGNNNVITGGTLLGSAQDLIVHQYGAGNFSINSIIANNGASSALTVTGTGTGLVLLGGANTFTGGIFINSAARLSLAFGGTFNSNALTFNNNSSGILFMNGVSDTVSGLNTSTVLAATLPIIQNANATAAVLTVNNAATSTYAGNFQDGTGGGAFGLTKSGAGILNLNGANTYTGATTVSNGTLFVKNNINTSKAIAVNNPGVLDVTTSGLTVGSGSTLSGTGSVLGTVTAGTGANLTPGALASIGTLTVANLNLNTGSIYNLDLSATTGVSDVIAATGALNLQTGINVNLAGAGGGIPGNVYTVMTYGSVSGFSASDFTIASGGTGGLTYTFADTGTGAITLTIGGSLAANSTWALTTGGSWNSPATNWTPNTVPQNAGDTANFNNTITASSTVTLDGGKTVGVLNFNSPKVYTIATGTGGNLILNNGASSANLTDTSTPGNSALPGQIISANVTLSSNSIVSVTSGETLAISGAIDGTGGLAKLGGGTLNLSSANSYAGLTTLSAGTMNFISGAVSSSAFTFAGGTLQYASGNTQDLSSARTVTISGAANIDTNGNDVFFGSAIGNAGAGGINKLGSGKLTLASGNTHTGANSVVGGTLTLSADSSLGAVPGAAAINMSIGAATLQFGAAMTLNANRSVVLSGGTAVLDTNSNNATVAGALSGTGLLDKVGAGTLTLSGGTNSTTATGGFTIDAGTVAVTNNANLPSGQLTMNGTAGLTASTATTFNPLVNGTNTMTESASVIFSLGNLTGAGTLTFTGPFVNDYTGNFTAFTGTLLATGGGSRWNGSTGGTNLSLDLGITGTSVRSNAAGITIGALFGQATASLNGGTAVTQAITYTIGGKTVGGLGVTPVDSVYLGVITNGGSLGTGVSITKVGQSNLTLGGASTYTGVTTISAGTLKLGDGTAGHDGTIAGASIVNNAALVFNRIGSTSYAGVISGSGPVTMMGTGMQTLTGVNTYSGVTTISGGTLQLGDGSTGNDGTIAGSLSVVNNAALVYNRFGNVGYAGVISGTGTVTKAGNGIQTLSGANTYTGITNINAGTLALGSAETPGVSGPLGKQLANAANTIVFGGGTLQFSATNTFDYSGRFLTASLPVKIDTNGTNVTFATPLIAGTADSLTLIDTFATPGTLTLTAASTYAGATTIGGGALYVGITTPTSSAALNTAGTVAVNGNGGTSLAQASKLRGTGTVGIIQATHTGVLTDAVVWPGVSASSSQLAGMETLVCNSCDLSAGGKLVTVLNHNPSGSPVNQQLATSGAGPTTVTLDGSSVLSFGNSIGQYTDQYIIVSTGPTVKGIAGAFNMILSSTLVQGNNANGTPTNTHDFDIVYMDTTGSNNTPLFNPAVGTVTAGTFNEIRIVFTGTSPGVTPIRIADFTAQAAASGVNVAWTAVSEYQNMGFNIYRREVGGLDWVQINPALLPGRMTNAEEKRYACFDWAPPGTFEYRLESVDLRNERALYYPESGSVSVDWNSRISYANADALSSLDAVSDSLELEASVAHAAEINTRFTALEQMDKAVSGRGGQSANGRILPRAVVVSSPARTRAELSTQTLPSVSKANAVAGVRWFSAGTPSASSAVGGGSSYAAAKVVYVSSGVLLITQASLPAGFDIRHVALQREGRSLSALALTPAGLLVYAPGYQDDYTDKDAIFLRRIAGGTAVGPNVAATGLFASQQPLNVTSPATVHTEYHDVYFDYNLRPYNFAPWFSGQYLTDGTTQNFALNTPQAASGVAQLTVNLWSLTDNSATLNPDHRLQVVINNQLAGETSWSGGNKMLQLSFTIPNGVLLNGNNTVSLVTPSIAGQSSQIALLHSMAMNYTRLLDGSQSFPIANSSGSAQLFELYNIPASGAYVVDTRFTDRAVLMPVETLAQPDGTLRLRFVAETGGSGQYQFIPAGQEHMPLAVSLRQVKALRLGGTYLATGPSQFAAGVQPLLSARAREGIRGVYADQEQLFDYYNYGRYGPEGIRKAVRSAHPAYLLLLGRTTYDYRNYSGLNVDPLCPAFLVSTSFWAQTTSDSAFGDLGRGYSEVSVGRLPIENSADLGTAVNRILAYKGLPSTGSGIRVHGVADRADPDAGDFAAQLATLQSAHPDLTWQTNALGITYPTAGEVHNAMSDAANGGADLIIYAGHGNASRLGKDNPRILDNTTIADWKGNIVFIQATCTANWDANNLSGYKSIAMTALTQPNGGISASIASSTYMNSEVAADFMNQLLKNASVNTSARWGTALMKTQQWAARKSGVSTFYTDLSNTEQVFGDPAMRIYAAPAPVPGASGSSGSATHTGSF